MGYLAMKAMHKMKMINLKTINNSAYNN